MQSGEIYSIVRIPFCELCQVGYYSMNFSSATCVACPMGRYGEVAGLAKCPKCPPGKFESFEHAGGCQEASEGHILTQIAPRKSLFAR